MQALSRQLTAPTLTTLLNDGALAGDWVLDPARSSVRLKTRVIWGLVPVTGVFREISGRGTVTPDGQVSGSVTVNAAAIDTNNPRRDAHLRSADFFQSAQYPYITFTAEGIRQSGSSVAVTGALTVRGRTRPVFLDVAATRHGSEIGLDAEVRIDRADFGLTWDRLGLTSMHNTITVHATFTQN